MPKNKPPLAHCPDAMVVDRPLRVLHCPWNIAGQSAQLAAAERELGADSRCIVIEETGSGFPADVVLAGAGPTVFRREAARWRLLWRALTWADVVHFSFGQSCLVPNAYPSLHNLPLDNPIALVWRLYCRSIWLRDLPVLHFMGKGLAVSWQGDDARQKDRSLELFDISIATAVGDDYYVPGSDSWKRKTIAQFRRYVPVHYALNPDLLNVLPAKSRFLPYASLDPWQYQPIFPRREAGKPLVFAHAPSHRGAKGTEHILAAAQALKDQGAQFELRLIEGVARDVALARYAEADVIVDQLLAGWYGGLGVEAMALGKPVIAYLRHSDLAPLDSEMRQELPVTSATALDIGDVMKRFIYMPGEQLHNLGRNSRNFVERWHDPRAIARKTLADYRAALPGKKR